MDKMYSYLRKMLTINFCQWRRGDSACNYFTNKCRWGWGRE